MSSDAPKTPGTETGATTRGAIITTAYVERQVKAYAVLETEVSSLSTLNTLATTFFSVGTGLASVSAGIWITAAYTENLSATGEVLAKTVAPLVLVLSCIFFWLARWAVQSRRSSWQVVVDQSKASQRPGP